MALVLVGNSSFGPRLLNSNLTFYIQSLDTGGSALDADAVPTYSVYEEETGTAIVTGSMAKLDDAGTTGFYSEQIALTDANGYELHKDYCVRIAATVDGQAAVSLYTLRIGPIDAIRSETAQAGAAGTITLDAGASATDDLYNGLGVQLIGGTGEGQIRLITDYVGSTKVATVVPNWVTNPSSSSIFLLRPWNGVSVAAMEAGVITAAVIATDAIDADAIAANAIDASAIADGAIDAGAIADGAIDAATFAAGAINAAAIADGAIDAATFAAGAINAAAIAADAIGASELAADAVTEIRSVVSGTSDSGTTLTMVDAARTEADTDYWKGAVILFTSGTISGQARLITGFNAATDTITFAPATTQAVSTQTYEILPQGGVDIQLWRGSVPNGLNLGRVDVLVTAMDPNVITATVIAADAIGASELATDAVNEIAAATTDQVWDEILAGHVIAGSTGEALALAAAGGASPGAIADAVWDELRAGHVVSGSFGEGVASVQGNVTGSVGSVAAGGITAASIATDAIDADAIAAGAIDAAAIADGAIDAATFAAGAITAAAIAADAIGASELAADAVAEIADQVWDEILAGHLGAGSTGEALAAAAAGGSTPAAIADAVWDELRAGHVIGGSFGEGVASVQGNVTGSVGSVTGNVGGNVVGNVNGNVVGSVGSVAAGGISAASIATDAIDADAIAASAVTEIQAGLATSAAVAAVQADTDDIQARLPATLSGGRMRSQVEGMDAGTVTAAVIATNAIDADALAADAVGEIADGVWDEPTAGHNTTGTFGQVLFPIRAGTAQAGAATTITLDVGASAVDDYYNGMLAYWTSGGGDLQARSITDYVGATKVATVSPAWAVNPAAGNAFVILPEPTVTGSTSTPADVADAVWDELRAAHVIAGSFGEGVASVQGNVTGSVGSVAAGGITAASIATDAIDADAIAANAIDASALATDAVNEIAAATTDQVWDEILAGHLAVGSTGEALNNAAAGGSPGAIADAVWDEARAGHVAAGSFGEHVLADVTLISGDATAADNVEAAFETGGANTVTMRLAQLSVVNSGGDAIVASSTGGNGHGVNASGNGSGDGIRATGGATNDSTGIRGASAATNGYGIQGVGSGTRSGVRGIGGATGHGIHGFGGATSGHGVLGQGNANGSGLRGIGGGTAGNSGIVGESGPTGHGIHGFGDGVGNGILGVGGATGHGAQLAGGATSGHGLAAVGQGAGHGILAQGGITSGIGILARAQANNDRGMSCEANGSGAGFVAAGGTGGGDGLAAVGNGIGAGLRATGGATGDGIRSLGGSTSGDGLHVEAQTAGDGLQAVGAGGGLPYNPAIGTPAENADAVWDEILGGHLGIGSTGEALAAAAAGGATPGAIADAVWDEATSGHLISGTFGQAQNSIRAGTAQGGGGTTITLDAGASAVDDFYNFTLVFVTGGTGAGQSRMISDYVGATKVATVNATWGTNPDGTSVFVILPFGSIPGVVAPSAADNANAVWDELTGEGRALGSYGQLLKDDIDATISSRASAAALAVAQADLDNIQTRLPAGLNGGRMSSHVEAMDAAVVNQIVDQTWDEILAGHLNVGSTGEALNDAAAGGGGGGASAAAVADAVWEEQKADHEGATIFGNVGQDLDDLEFTGNEG